PTGPASTGVPGAAAVCQTGGREEDSGVGVATDLLHRRVTIRTPTRSNGSPMSFALDIVRVLDQHRRDIIRSNRAFPLNDDGGEKVGAGPRLNCRARLVRESDSAGPGCSGAD